MASSKTPVIEYLFFNTKGYTSQSGLSDPVVTFDEVTAAIAAVNPTLAAEGRKTLSAGNPANFWKDLTRKNPAGSWPVAVLAAGFVGDDAIGMGNRACFRFVPVGEGDEHSVESAFGPSPQASENVIVLESLSMPNAMKALGRRDENWLAQVAARLRILETHFAVVSEFDAAEMTFLQTGIKLRSGEVDSAYSMVDGSGGRWLLSVEAKGRTEVIHVPQILRAATGFLDQARAKHLDVLGVIPMALKVIGTSRVHVVEFDPDGGSGSSGSVVADSVIELQPHVSGIE